MVTELEETVARIRGSGPTATRDPRRRPGSPTLGKEGATGAGRLSVRKGSGKTQKRRRGRVKVNAPPQKEGTTAEKYRREGKSQRLLEQEVS